jgi:hypothetical protein
MRVRGLKPSYTPGNMIILVAPHAGARIETLVLTQTDQPEQVAPHAGARIETLFFMNDIPDIPRRTSCGCAD